MEIIGVIVFLLGLGLIYMMGITAYSSTTVWKNFLIALIATIGFIACLLGGELIAGVPLTEVI